MHIHSTKKSTKPIHISTEYFSIIKVLILAIQLSLLAIEVWETHKVLVTHILEGSHHKQLYSLSIYTYGIIDIRKYPFLKGIISQELENYH